MLRSCCRSARRRHVATSPHLFCRRSRQGRVVARLGTILSPVLLAVGVRKHHLPHCALHGPHCHQVAAFTTYSAACCCCCCWRRCYIASTWAALLGSLDWTILYSPTCDCRSMRPGAAVGLTMGRVATSFVAAMLLMAAAATAETQQAVFGMGCFWCACRGSHRRRLSTYRPSHSRGSAIPIFIHQNQKLSTRLLRQRCTHADEVLLPSIPVSFVTIMFRFCASSGVGKRPWRRLRGLSAPRAATQVHARAVAFGSPMFTVACRQAYVLSNYAYFFSHRAS